MLSAMLGLVLYWFCELAIRRISYENVGIGRRISLFQGYKWECWKDVVIFVSPGFWLARRYKEEIRKIPEHLPYHLKKYITANNHFNLGFTLILFLVLSLLWFVDGLLAVFFYFVCWRFVSRSFEIAYAFGNDAVTGHKQQTSSLTKFERIRLALKSYAEIFVYSASLYLVSGVGNPACSLFASFGVGPLTNVSQVATRYGLASVAYAQVFTTSSLVVLSLAVYVSRDH